MKKLKLHELNRLTPEDYLEAEKLPLVVVCDNIRSSNNVGSIFRTSDALGVEQVYLAGITPKPPNRDIIKTAIGAEEVVQWTYFESISETCQKLVDEGYTLLAVEQTDESIDLMEAQIEKDQKIALILGNEVKGVSNEALTFCHQAIELAQYGTKHSLNVAVCGGIVIHHFSNLLRKS